MAQPLDLDGLAALLPADAATLLRSLRQRLSAIPNLSFRFEPHGAERGELVLVHRGAAELGCLFLRAGSPIRLQLRGEAEAVELRGLAEAAALADRVRALAEERVKRDPQLALFGG